MGLCSQGLHMAGFKPQHARRGSGRDITAGTGGIPQLEGVCKGPEPSVISTLFLVLRFQFRCLGEIALEESMSQTNTRENANARVGNRQQHPGLDEHPCIGVNELGLCNLTAEGFASGVANSHRDLASHLAEG